MENNVVCILLQIPREVLSFLVWSKTTKNAYEDEKKSCPPQI